MLLAGIEANQRGFEQVKLRFDSPSRRMEIKDYLKK